MTSTAASAIERDLVRLRETVRAFCEFARGLPARELREQAWGPREVLIHLVFHHESYADQAAARLRAKPFEPPAGFFREINARAVESNRGVPAEMLLARFERANLQLEELCRAGDPHSLVIEIKRGSKPRTLAGLIPEVEAHIRNHLVKLRRDQSRKSKTPRTSA